MAPDAEKVIPKFNNAVVVVTAPRISTIGYCREISAAQLAHRPPIATKLRTGILCKKERLCLQSSITRKELPTKINGPKVTTISDGKDSL